MHFFVFEITYKWWWWTYQRMRWSPSPAETFSPSHSTAPQCHLSRLTHRRAQSIERNARVRDDGDAQTATIFLLFSTATKRSFYDKELIGEQQLHRVTQLDALALCFLETTQCTCPCHQPWAGRTGWQRVCWSLPDITFSSVAMWLILTDWRLQELKLIQGCITLRIQDLGWLAAAELAVGWRKRRSPSHAHHRSHRL